jgi:hypothetical protein
MLLQLTAEFAMVAGAREGSLCSPGPVKGVDLRRSLSCRVESDAQREGPVRDDGERCHIQ